MKSVWPGMNGSLAEGSAGNVTLGQSRSAMYPETGGLTTPGSRPIILIAGIEIPVEICTLPNPVGAPCGAKVTHMADHVRWHSRNGLKEYRWCYVGEHVFEASKDRLKAHTCPAHIKRTKPMAEKGKRMCSSGIERQENIRQYYRERKSDTLANP